MKFINYLKETKKELKYVNWPAKKQAINYTALVIGLSAFVGIYLSVFDLLFNYLIIRLF